MNFWRGVPAVLSAFIGIRRHADAQRDQRLTALQIVLTAFVLAGCLAGGLLLLVFWLVG
ncbi:DUF2970 domain-containing protein [uncultured Aquitalea sp.]|uniref:DUF2970 domain-containing protein n=1 Tax=uncultured Aquitalea sp. TaxID=540272 RepID=UPI0025E1DB47|nr:DUF2970 domain-containing protein [uncultured Aquitalea sp.]